MRPPAPPHLLDAIERWAALSRWERAEVGRGLRRLGWSYGEIRELVSVPKATLSGWCRDIRLTDDQVAAIRVRSTSARGVPRDTQRRRRAEVQRIRAAAAAFAHDHLHDPLFVAGTALYWGEGAKTAPRLMITNGDDVVLRLFIRWVRRFHHPGAAFVLALHLHAGNDEAAARRWWAAALGLPVADFTATCIKAAGTGHRTNRLPQGVCRVAMRSSADAWHRTMAWIGVVGALVDSDGHADEC
jgi:hypothetical protein